MKFHKTPQKKRATYTYSYFNCETEKMEEIVICPSKDGVTEINIKCLHSFDDSEVHNNIKNSRPKLSNEENASIKEWEDSHPGEITFRTWNISLDACIGSEDDEYSSDKSKMAFELTTTLFDNEPSGEIFDLREFIATLPQIQQELYKLRYIEEYTQTEIARILKISDTAVHNRIKKLMETIKNNFKKNVARG